MDRDLQERIKHRDICFREPHEDPNQAQSAMLILSDVEGIIQLTPRHSRLIQVSYDITLISLQIIDDLLDELGFHLDNSLMVKLKRALYYYTENLQQETLGCRPGSSPNNTREVFMQRYQQLRHGCRDARPDHWRHYL